MKGTTMRYKYFKVTKDMCIEDVKKQYRELAMKHHPDRGGSDEAMKAINAEYTRLCAEYGGFKRNKQGERYATKNEEKPTEWIFIIDQLMKHPELTIEVIGTFLWVTGETKANAELLGALGMKYAAGKNAWFKAPYGWKNTGWHRSMNSLRNTYGSQVVQKKDGSKAKKTTRKTTSKKTAKSDDKLTVA